MFWDIFLSPKISIELKKILAAMYLIVKNSFVFSIFLFPSGLFWFMDAMSLTFPDYTN